MNIQAYLQHSIEEQPDGAVQIARTTDVPNGQLYIMCTFYQGHFDVARETLLSLRYMNPNDTYILFGHDGIIDVNEQLLQEQEIVPSRAGVLYIILLILLAAAAYMAGKAS